MIENNLRKVLLIGIGNEYRSDDGIGLIVARQIREKQIPFITVKEESGEGVSLMNAWQGFDDVILIDAVLSGAEPGTIFRFDATKGIMPPKIFHYSTHAFGVAEAIELARVLKTLSSNLIIYGIEGTIFNAGTTISPAVQESAKTVIEQILFLFMPNS